MLCNSIHGEQFTIVGNSQLQLAARVFLCANLSIVVRKSHLPLGHRKGLTLGSQSDSAIFEETAIPNGSREGDIVEKHPHASCIGFRQILIDTHRSGGSKLILLCYMLRKKLGATREP